MSAMIGGIVLLFINSPNKSIYGSSNGYEDVCLLFLHHRVHIVFVVHFILALAKLLRLMLTSLSRVLSSRSFQGSI